MADDGVSSSRWTAVSGCTRSYESIVGADGVTRTLAKMTGTAANTTAFVSWVPGVTFGPPPWATGVEIDIFVTEWTYSAWTSNGAPFTIQFRNEAGSEIAQAICQVLAPGWNRIRVAASSFMTVAGSATWKSSIFTQIRLRFGGIPGTTHSLYFGPMRWLSGESCGDRPKVCVCFDDNGLSVYNTAFPIMRARNIPGTNAVISDSVGSGSFGGYARCSLAQLREMNDAGWDCVNHTQTHTQNRHLSSQAVCETEIQTCRDYLIANNLGNGVSEHIFCSPYGEFSANYYAAADASGVKMFRRGIMASADYISPMSSAFLNLRAVPCHSIILATPTAGILQMVDTTIANGGSLILLFHHVVAPPVNSIDYSTANFTTVMDGLVAGSRAGKFDLVNMTDLYLASRLVV